MPTATSVNWTSSTEPSTDTHKEDNGHDTNEDDNNDLFADMFDETNCDQTIFRGSKNLLKLTERLVVRRIYLLGRILSQVFQEADLPYWVTGGTALGIERHTGLIPWDDDIDLCLPDTHEDKFLLLRQTLRDEYGVEIQESYSGYQLFHVTDSSPPQPGCTRRYPFCDVLIMRKMGDRFELRNGRSRAYWPDEIHLLSDLEPRVARLFGNYKLMCSNNQIPYLKRTYGDSCLEVGSTHMYSHIDGTNLQPQTVCLETVGFEPAKPFD